MSTIKVFGNIFGEWNCTFSNNTVYRYNLDGKIITVFEIQDGKFPKWDINHWLVFDGDKCQYALEISKLLLKANSLTEAIQITDDYLVRLEILNLFQ